jgi:tetratricopeptide (TPR) repeat protein
MVRCQIYFIFLCSLTLILITENIYKSLVPNLLWVYYVRQNLLLVQDSVNFPEDVNIIYPEAIEDIPSLKENSSISAIKTTLNDLEIAAKLRPQNWSTYYLIGEIYAALGQWKEAFKFLQMAYEFSRHNPKIAWHLALVLEHIEPNSSSIVFLYKESNLDHEKLSATADFFLQTSRLIKSRQYYRRAALFDVYAPVDSYTLAFAFRRLLSQITIRGHAIDTNIKLVHQFDNTFTINKLDSYLYINGAQLRLATSVNPPTMTFGTPLNYPLGGTIGMFWWTSRGTAIIDVGRDSSYTMTLNLRQSIPPPVVLAIGIDGMPIRYLTLSAGDNTWESFTFPLILSKGIHTIDIWYLNNKVIEGKDRDAALMSITLEHSCLLANCYEDR